MVVSNTIYQVLNGEQYRRCNRHDTATAIRGRFMSHVVSIYEM